MRLPTSLLLALLLSACAAPPLAPRADQLFHDQLFQAPAEPISAAEVFALSGEMKDYLNTVIASQLRSKGPQQGLIDALYSKQQLQLEYDATMTRNAAQAFAARSGNCLSLVLMTAAFAKELDLPVQYQTVFVDETWSRSGDLYLSSEHINLSLGHKPFDARSNRDDNYQITIDFLPQREIRGQRSRVIDEDTVIAMYMNNRAAEALARGQVNAAYWWARAAIHQAPRFISAYNTLGVIYRRHGNLPEAEQIFTRVLEREPENTDVMSNLVLVLKEQGRADESASLARKLEQIQPYPPFYFFNRGMAAMHVGDFQSARDLFLKEIKRAAYYHEFHYWLASAYYNLGETQLAREHLNIALENSATRSDQDLYAAKLERIKSEKSALH